MEKARVKMNDYEAQRNAKVKQNEELLASLGVRHALQELRATSSQANSAATTPVKKLSPYKFKARPSEIRRSARTKQKPYYKEPAVDGDHNSENESPSSPSSSSAKRRLSASKSPSPIASEEKDWRDPPPTKNRNTKADVLCWGSIVPASDPDADLYRHPQERFPYPVGYKATRQALGQVWMQEILRGPQGQGPIFVVSDPQDATKRFEGGTPTAPWTICCRSSKTPKTRISGPLFFGLQDAEIRRKLWDMMHGPQPSPSSSGPAPAHPMYIPFVPAPGAAAVAAVASSSSSLHSSISPVTLAPVPVKSAFIPVPFQLPPAVHSAQYFPSSSSADRSVISQQLPELDSSNSINSGFFEYLTPESGGQLDSFNGSQFSALYSGSSFSSFSSNSSSVSSISGSSVSSTLLPSASMPLLPLSPAILPFSATPFSPVSTGSGMDSLEASPFKQRPNNDQVAFESFF